MINLRDTEILKLARLHGKVTVEGLARHFDVTPQTIRRNLGDLAESGHLKRVHGGAVLPSGTANLEYQERRALNPEGKRDIAKRCARLIPNDSAICINIGTTTEAVAQELLTHEGLLVVTNNINVATTLSGNPNVRTMVLGGTLRPADGGLIGEQTVKMVENFKFDLAVIGCSAIDADGDVLDFDNSEVAVTRTILRQSRKVTLVADHQKLEQTAPYKICGLDQIDVLICDIALPKPLAQLCKANGRTQIA